MSKKPLVVGNWKLNGSLEFTKDLINQLTANLQNTNCKVAIAPPVMYLQTAKECAGNLFLATQNVDVNTKGAFTGDISIEMLKEFGVRFVIIGHSERREYHNETDQFIAQKFATIKNAGLTPILCIGENEQEFVQGLTKEICKKQIKAVIDANGIKSFENAVIAYEPIWAIGTGKSATPEQAGSVHKFIRSYLAEFDADIAKSVTIQYGGSVNENNAYELFLQSDIDGALVGGASLKAEQFIEIIKAAEKAKS